MVLVRTSHQYSLLFKKIQWLIKLNIVVASYKSVLFCYNPTVPTSSPRITAAVPVDPTTVELSWNPPSPDEQNGVIVYYIIHITAIHPHMGETFQQNCTMVSCNVSQLYPYHTYQFTVSAVTIAPGPHSETSTVTTLESGMK